MKKTLTMLAAAAVSALSAQAQLPRQEYHDITPHYHEVDGKLIRCYSHEKAQEAIAADPELASRRARINAQIEKYIAKGNFENRTPGRTTNVVYTIPVVVHVVYRTAAGNLSAARVQEQIDRLNLDYRRLNADASQTPSVFSSIVADTEIEFCLATRDPQGNSTTGIVYTQTNVTNIGQGNSYYSTAAGGSTAWNTSNYLNLWVCEVGGGILGYAYQPGNAGAAFDGVVIDYQYFGATGATAPYNMGRTATHEVGHWFNLDHIWGDAAGCSPDDNVSDTPLQDSEYYGCPSFPQTTCSSSDMFMNYMDYVDDNCMNSFTTGQKTRMRAAITASRPGLLTSLGCVSSPNDAGISQIISPTGTLCSGTFVPQVVIKNIGSSNLTSATINYRVDGGATSTQAWSGNLTTNQTQTVTLSSMTVSDGAHILEAWTTLPNGLADGDASNDESEGGFSINSGSGAQALPYTQGFENASFPPAGWSSSNPDGLVTWARTTDAAKTGVASMFMDNWDYTDNGQVDEVSLPALDLSTGGTVTMKFDLAYALYSATGFSDTLRVYASNNCGQTWTEVYEKAGNALSTTGSTSAVEFVPTSNQWRNETINLDAYNGSSNVILKFQHVTDYENNLYVDNINISSVGGNVGVTPTADNDASLAVYPNPTNNVLNINVYMGAQQDIEIVLFNSLGQVVSRMKDKAVLSGIYQMDMSALSGGLYHVQVLGSEGSLSAKVVKN